MFVIGSLESHLDTLIKISSEMKRQLIKNYKHKTHTCANTHIYVYKDIHTHIYIYIYIISIEPFVVVRNINSDVYLNTRLRTKLWLNTLTFLAIVCLIWHLSKQTSET